MTNRICLVRNIAFIIGFVVATAVSIVCQVAKPTNNTLIPCQWEIAAKGAEFRQSFGYSLEVSDNGVVSKVTEISNSQRRMKARLVRDEVFVECMKKWHLEPVGKYFVSFNVGTMSTDSEPSNYMLIIDPNKNTLKIEIYLAVSDTLIVEKPTKKH